MMLEFMCVCVLLIIQCCFAFHLQTQMASDSDVEVRRNALLAQW